MARRKRRRDSDDFSDRLEYGFRLNREAEVGGIPFGRDDDLGVDLYCYDRGQESRRFVKKKWRRGIRDVITDDLPCPLGGW
jgi:hypothetical protein